MSNPHKVLVVGTTPDYVYDISQNSPERAVFLTDISLKGKSFEVVPDEIYCNLSDYKATLIKLRQYISANNYHITGLTCFDCESLKLAAFLAEKLSLPYPDMEAVTVARDKNLAKELFQENGLPTGAFALVDNFEDAKDFFLSNHSDCVIKPVSGSGSELVFRCQDVDSLKNAVEFISEQLSGKKSNRMYADFDGSVIIEAYHQGREFSCDAVESNGNVQILRVTEKIFLKDAPLGTVRAYVYPAHLPEEFPLKSLKKMIHQAATTLGISGVIFMTDFIVGRNGAVILEITPRPGGDCLPALMWNAKKVDILKTALDVAEGQMVTYQYRDDDKVFVGLRIHARKEGQITSINARTVIEDPRVHQVNLLKKAGDIVVLPPKSYDNWLVASVIFCPTDDDNIEQECNEIASKLHLEIEGLN